MIYASIFIFLLMLLLNIIFKIASIFRLGIPMFYALFIAILLPEFVHEHDTLVTVIFLVLLGCVALSWVVTISRKLRHR